MSFFEKLSRRNAFRAGIVYSVAAWPLKHGTATVFPRIGLPVSAVTLAIVFINEQDGPSLARLHVAAQTRESASLLRSPALNATALVGTSLCQVKVIP